MIQELCLPARAARRIRSRSGSAMSGRPGATPPTPSRRFWVSRSIFGFIRAWWWLRSAFHRRNMQMKQLDCEIWAVFSHEVSIPDGMWSWHSWKMSKHPTRRAHPQHCLHPLSIFDVCYDLCLFRPFCHFINSTEQRFFFLFVHVHLL